MGELEVKSADNDPLGVEFASSCRTGRRNALAIVEVEGIDPETIKLAERLSNISAHDKDDQHNTPSSSSLSDGTSWSFRLFYQ
ncbi:unnamed protein product [Anisakis simplex]|uniref:Uncharacterized protein n=1 Tax=Anisakis simplex TaxID=6269 RepID=A0A0M3K0A0_ANISI|nr:unnamed protein product [Anisakis simplex]